MKSLARRGRQFLVDALYALALSNKSIPQFSPRMSVRRMAKIKAGILVKFIIDSLLSVRSEKESLVGIRRYSRLDKKSSVLVIANGPTAQKLNLAEVMKYKSLGEIEVFGVNFAILDEKFEAVIDFLVLSDPGMHPNCESERAVQLWEKIVRQERIKIVTPTSWHVYLKDSVCKSIGCLHFKDTSLEGFSLNIDPTKPRGYISLTAYKALAVALFFRYRNTFVVGIDNSMFRKITVDENNKLIQLSNHGAGLYPISEDFSEYFPDGIFDYFYDLSEAFRSLKYCFGRLPIINLGIESEVDCFEKITPNNPFYNLINS